MSALIKDPRNHPCPFYPVRTYWELGSLQPEVGSHQTWKLQGPGSSASLPPELWEMNFCCLWATRSTGSCYSSLNWPTQPDSKSGWLPPWKQIQEKWIKITCFINEAVEETCISKDMIQKWNWNVRNLQRIKTDKNRKVTSYGSFIVLLSNMKVPQEFTIIHLVHFQWARTWKSMSEAQGNYLWVLSNRSLPSLWDPICLSLPQSLRLSNHARLPVLFYFLGEQQLAREFCSLSQAPGKGVFVLSLPDNSNFWGFLWSSYRSQVDTKGWDCMISTEWWPNGQEK